MHGHIAHLAVNADDLPATRAFYEGVFGWRFEEYAPGFVRTHDAGGPIAAVQGRRALLAARTNAPEVTFEVDDVDAFAAEAVRLGGRVVMPKATIPGVGSLVFVADPSGNLVGGIRYA
jgi:predicted enzyme related to lactoylglutathione lyase